MHQKHDRSYHRLFSEPKLVEDLVRNFVNEPWVSDLDFSKMERINTKFHSDALERRDGDVILRIPFLQQSAQEIYLFLLLEFQSTPDEWMALRFGTYVHLLYEQLVKEQRLTPDGRLPPVFPLLLYNGDKNWDKATDLKALISLPPNTPLWQWQPGMRYYLIDESRYPEGKPGSLSGLIFRLENAQTPQDFKRALEETVLVIPKHLDSVKRAIAVWITYVLAPHKGIQLTPRDTEDLDEVKNMLATRIEQWENDILEKGIEKGIEKGEILVLQRQLAKRFGELPDWTLQRLEQATKLELELWADQILDADTLQAVFQ